MSIHHVIVGLWDVSMCEVSITGALSICVGMIGLMTLVIGTHKVMIIVIMHSILALLARLMWFNGHQLTQLFCTSITITIFNPLFSLLLILSISTCLIIIAMNHMGWQLHSWDFNGHAQSWMTPQRSAHCVIHESV